MMRTEPVKSTDVIVIKTREGDKSITFGQLAGLAVITRIAYDGDEDGQAGLANVILHLLAELGMEVDL